MAEKDLESIEHEIADPCPWCLGLGCRHCHNTGLARDIHYSSKGYMPEFVNPDIKQYLYQNERDLKVLVLNALIDPALEQELKQYLSPYINQKLTATTQDALELVVHGWLRRKIEEGVL